MGFESDDDRLLFLRDFGSCLTAPNGTCLAIRDVDYLETEGIDGLAVALQVRTSDVAAFLPKGTPVTFEGTNYTINVHKPDGTGMSVVTLRST